MCGSINYVVGQCVNVFDMCDDDGGSLARVLYYLVMTGVVLGCVMPYPCIIVCACCMVVAFWLVDIHGLVTCSVDCVRCPGSSISLFV